MEDDSVNTELYEFVQVRYRWLLSLLPWKTFLSVVL